MLFGSEERGGEEMATIILMLVSSNFLLPEMEPGLPRARRGGLVRASVLGWG